MKEINSLSEFVAEVEKLDGHYYRGEATEFLQKNVASGYRWMGRNHESFDSLLELRKKYYQEIGYSLSIMDVENFISYSQHHGLPTELLDVTRNALVALYFACDVYIENKKECDGYVYSLDKKRVVDFEKQIITKNIEKQNINFHNKVINKFFSCDLWTCGACDDDLEFLYEFLKLIDDTSSLLEYIKKSNMCTKNFLHTFFKNYNPSLKDYNSAAPDPYGNNKKINDIINLFVNAMAEECSKAKNNIEEFKDEIKNIKVIEHWMQGEDVIEYSDGVEILLPNPIATKLVDDEILNFILALISFEIYKNSTGINFPPIKYWVHKPSVIFDRMRNQQGNFIYQNHIILDGKVLVQPFESKETFKIPAEKKNKIRTQLDSIGINGKFIYPDADNIAIYIQNHFK